MSLNAAQRGWGNIGAPGSAAGKKYRTDNITTIKAAGISLPVHKAVAPLFQAAINEVAARGYLFNDVPDDWGTIHRFIRGREKGSDSTLYDRLSNHSWGLAVDLNATKNPMTSDGKVHTDMPGWVIEVFHRYGFKWGGEYTGARKDPMHFEFMGTPADAARLVAGLKAGSAAPVYTHPEEEMLGLNISDDRNAAITAWCYQFWGMLPTDTERMTLMKRMNASGADATVTSIVNHAKAKAFAAK